MMAGPRRLLRESGFSRESGMFHVTIDPEGPGVLRLHLRRAGASMLAALTRRPRNLLWINGSQLLLLDESNADIMQTLIEVAHERTRPGSEVSEETWLGVRRETAERVHRLYRRVPTAQIEGDIDYLYGLIVELSRGACPSERGVPGRAMAEAEWHAPARMDLMISSMGGSGCQNACAWCYASDMPGVRELDTTSWKLVLDRLWEAGIPMVNFTGGEPTMRRDLVDLVRHAEKFVTGLITNGRALAGLVGKLKEASLDYIQVSVESADPGVHDAIVGSAGAWEETTQGIRAALDAGMYVSTNTTLTRANVGGFPALLRFLAGIGVRYVGCNALIPAGRGAHHPDALRPQELKAVLEGASAVAAELGLEFNWFTPTCYNDLDPVAMGLGAKSCSACHTNMAVRPDGVVVPCQSWLHDEGLGSILTTSWKRIFNHPLARKIRAHGFAPPECRKCGYFAICGGACPLERVNRAAQGKPAVTVKARLETGVGRGTR
ncbi:MAG: radical SAM protein [Bacillota bacterium]|nr:radical SAM protein [Bacillota bacterium]